MISTKQIPPNRLKKPKFRIFRKPIVSKNSNVDKNALRSSLYNFVNLDHEKLKGGKLKESVKNPSFVFNPNNHKEHTKHLAFRIQKRITRHLQVPQIQIAKSIAMNQKAEQKDDEAKDKVHKLADENQKSNLSIFKSGPKRPSLVFSIVSLGRRSSMKYNSSEKTLKALTNPFKRPSIIIHPINLPGDKNKSSPKLTPRKVHCSESGKQSNPLASQNQWNTSENETANILSTLLLSSLNRVPGSIEDKKKILELSRRASKEGLSSVLISDLKKLFHHPMTKLIYDTVHCDN